MLNAGAAGQDILRTALPLEPGADLRARLICLDNVKPVAVRPLVRILARENLTDFTGVELIGQRNNLAVHLCTGRSVADLCVNMIGKVDDGRADRQRNGIALRRHDNNVLRRNIVLDSGDKLLGIVAGLLGFKYLPDPRNTRIHDGLALNALLVFPVRSNTVFRIGMHFPCADLHLKRDALFAEYGGVQRLIAVRLRVGDVILEAVRDRPEHIVDQTKHAVAFVIGRDDHAHRVLVIDLVNGFVVYIDLFIDAVDALDAAVDLRRGDEILRLKALRDPLLDALDERLALLLFVVEQALDLRIGIRVKVIEREILKLLLHGCNAEPVCDRRIDVHGLKRRVMLLVDRAVLQGAHIVQAVGQLDDHDADVLRHCKQNLHDVFSLLLLLGKGRHLGQLCDAVHEHGNVMAEALLHILSGRGGVLDNIVQQRRAERIRIHSELQQDIRNGYRMNDIRLAGRADLSLMALRGVFICRNQLADVVLPVICQDFCDNHVNRIGLFMKLRHRIISFHMRSCERRTAGIRFSVCIWQSSCYWMISEQKYCS